MKYKHIGNGINKQEYFALLVISDHDGISTADLSELMNRNHRTTQGVCKSLEDKGFISREGRKFFGLTDLDISPEWKKALAPYLKPLKKNKERALLDLCQRLSPTAIDWDKVSGAKHPLHFLIASIPLVSSPEQRHGQNKVELDTSIEQGENESPSALLSSLKKYSHVE